MKSLLLSFSLLYFFLPLVSAQEPTSLLQGKVSGVNIKGLQNDSIPRVVNLNNEIKTNQPHFYINGVLSQEGVINTINPESIESVEVKKDKESTYEHGEIHITLKQESSPTWISINQLKSKYFPKNSLPTLYLLDGKSIQEDFDLYHLDEKNLLKIEIEEVDIDDLKINIIRLYTRSEENLENDNRIILRGLRD